MAWGNVFLFCILVCLFIEVNVRLSRAWVQRVTQSLCTHQPDETLSLHAVLTLLTHRSHTLCANAALLLFEHIKHRRPLHNAHSWRRTLTLKFWDSIIFEIYELMAMLVPFTKIRILWDFLYKTGVSEKWKQLHIHLKPLIWLQRTIFECILNL